MPRARVMIAVGLAVLCAGALAASAQAALWNYTKRHAYSFVSAPNLHPPKISVKVKSASKLAHGSLLLANTPDLSAGLPMAGQSGPLITDNRARPIWFLPVSRNVVANNLAEQTFNGQPVLTYWQGVMNSSGIVTDGEDVVLDQHYKPIARLHGANGWIVDLHEFVISGNDAWVIATKQLKHHSFPGQHPSRGTLVDTAVQEYDLTKPDGSPAIFTWDPLARIPLTDSYSHPDSHGLWDPYHLNSVQLQQDGTFLVSMRNTWAAYDVDPSTHTVVWKLGGKHLATATNFTTASSKAKFQWQHDVQMHPGGVVSMFDDHCCSVTSSGAFKSPTGPSRGLVLQLDMTNHTYSLVTQYVRDKSFDAAFLGSLQLLSNGNALVVWGSRPFFSEFSSTGSLIFDATWPTPDLTYRAYLQSWVGLPGYRPAGAVKTKGSRATVYASWNGANQVKKWEVLAGTGSKHLSKVATSRWKGFETSIGLSKKYGAYELEAFDSHGNLLGKSKVITHITFGSY